MTELELYKFCEDKEISWRGEKLIIWLYSFQIEEFVKMVGDDYFSEGDVEVTLLPSGVIAVELNIICDNYDIEVENILQKDNSY